MFIIYISRMDINLVASHIVYNFENGLFQYYNPWIILLINNGDWFSKSL